MIDPREERKDNAAAVVEDISSKELHTPLNKPRVPSRPLPPVSSGVVNSLESLSSPPIPPTSTVLSDFQSQRPGETLSSPDSSVRTNDERPHEPAMLPDDQP